jgi:trans-aconitate 2-methyltransferase
MHKWDAVDYQKHSEAQLSWGKELIAKLGLSGHEHVLDIGCGDGKVTAEIAACVPAGQVVGIDSSRDMIDLACRTYPAGNFSNLRFLLMDAQKLNFTDAFDVIFSNAVLHWVDDHRKVLSGIHNSLRSRGKILLQMGGKGNVADMMAVMLSMSRQPVWKTYFQGFTSPFNFYGLDEYGGWLAEAGLTPLRIELIPRDMALRGKEGLCGWVRTVWHPFIHRVPETNQQEYIDQAVDLYLQDHPADENGFVHVGVVRLEVEAEKR